MFNFKKYRHLIILVHIVALFVCSADAQTRDSMYVGNADNLYTASADTMSVFGNVIHNGTWGTTTGSYVYFLGQTWKNTPTSRFPLMNATATDGGVFCIKQPALTYSQIIKGGYNRRILSSGPVFPNLVIANPGNVYLDSTDVAVYNTVKMDTGLVYMSANAGGLDNTQNSFVLGGGSLKPRVIDYNSDKYFVSGVLPNDTSYFYIRNVVLSDTTVFPVGSKARDYTPAGVTAISGDVMVRTFDGAYQNGNTGALITGASYLQKSWQVITPSSATANYNLILQHHSSNETAAFSGSRDQSYISKYNENDGWDIVAPNQPPYTQASLFPNTGNGGDSVFYHWRVLNQILNSGTTGSYYTKRVVESNLLNIDKSVVGIAPVMPDSTFNIMFKIAVTNNNKTAVNNVAVSDNLANVFPFPTVFKVSSIRSSNGYLNLNHNYTGSGADTLLAMNGLFAANTGDTIYLLVNLDLYGSGIYSFTNTAYTGFNNSSNILYDALDASSVTFNIPLYVFVPDGFSPNHDGINDRFEIRHKLGQTIDLTVFNRWGNIVFKENNYKNDWDGKGVGGFLGKDLEEGTYYVFVIIHDTQNGDSKIVKPITIRRSY